MPYFTHKILEVMGVVAFSSQYLEIQMKVLLLEVEQSAFQLVL
uniref:Uncharacterized protein n=1 Tax=Rhizophora mucronata TaxID=61149 RepID=A0A2P2PS94_RHIMU